MLNAKRKQLLVISGAIVLTIVLYLAPGKIKQQDAGKPGEETNQFFSFESLLVSAKRNFKRQELGQIEKLEGELSKDQNNVLLLDTLGKLWDKMDQPVISSHYFEMIAVRQPGEKNWLNAAYRFFDASQMSGDSLLRVMVLNKAIASYNNVLKYNPDNLDAKTDLGICYAVGSTEPMKGILMLRDVVSKNPNHENAQFNLGILSVKSGQYEKAVERFQKVLEINPARKEMYFMIGKAYFLSGNKEKALQTLEKLKKETVNAQLIEEANSLISQININQ